MWQECGFCSLESSADLTRHVYFHCYHTKLKQWGLRALQSQSDVSHCQLDFQSRNIIPEIQENFLCLWEYCEVRTENPVSLLYISSLMVQPREGELVLSCMPACICARVKEPVVLRLISSPCFLWPCSQTEII